MPPSGRLPHSGDGGLDLRRQILTSLGLLLVLPLLRWLEGGDAGSGTVFPNKLVATGSSLSMDGSKDDTLLAGRGSVGESQPDAARCVPSSLLAGHGGEEEQKRSSPILDWGEGSCPLRRCGCCSNSTPLLSSSSCRGGERGSGGRADWIRARRRLPAGCYGASSSELLRAKHASLLIDDAIFGRHGGPTTTSKTEALLCFVRRGSTLLRRQVVRPRRRRSDRRMQSCAGSVLLGISAPHLDGNVLRSPAVGGGGTQGPDCFFIFCSRVLFVNFEVLSSNSWFLSASDVKGPLCNLYPPRVE
ncbi:uncharacterized protein [Lolium perenne]|uniref:uncharacterized protein isoform X2 n=1 Tax=Lolium perenne TaxID=4522 RepID=UPI003A99D06E